ncbi:DUF4258 domain-containing protein [Aquibium microcysteis]|uniref:DUF4258 domain-containing protein n=1 Tax=Aquibium microcysteis TaxID=675281 RepID=UPI00165CFFFD|nr:DUF4258 domain-containing protein [Aquibium microcysteis]
MDDLADRIRARIEAGRVRVSDHAQGRLSERGILFSDVLASVPAWTVVEIYVTGRMGPSFLARHVLSAGTIHAVWGMMDDTAVHAVLVTVYLPDKDKWDEHSTSRREA